jgi:putative FmdB family regulatory protein
VPLYEYQCDQCGRFEVIQKFSDAPLASCPTCAREVQKQVSAPAIQFKGTGWYITDYARKNSGSSSKGEGGGDKTTATGDAAAAKTGAADSTTATSSSTSTSSSAPSKTGGGNAA